MAADARADLRAVVEYWRDVGYERWFKRDDALDREIGTRFRELHAQASTGVFDALAHEPTTALGLVILLDQFSRNLHRDSRLAFAQDERAVALAPRAIEHSFDKQVEEPMRPFFYLPFMHSESLADQDRALELYAPIGGDQARYAAIHHDVIVRFGRFPHRNAALGRETTPEEQAFLDAGGFKG